MIKIAVVSGKGGTGKTMVTAALTDLCTAEKSLADCDVEASNLALLLGARQTGSELFSGMEIAVIDQPRCTDCGLCAEHCRFDAIVRRDETCQVDPIRCEGCGVCEYICPVGAIGMKAKKDGELLSSDTEFGHLSHARLDPGSGNSGLLVHEVRKRAAARIGTEEIMLVDGPPGIGCPLISTISGMDVVLIVTEPSLSGLHDLGRLVTVCRRFGIRIFASINRFDLATAITRQIEDYCGNEEIAVVGKIPFDPAVIESVRQGRPVTRHTSPASDAIRAIWDRLSSTLGVA